MDSSKYLLDNSSSFALNYYPPNRRGAKSSGSAMNSGTNKTASQQSSSNRPVKVPRSMWSITPDITIFSILSLASIYFYQLFPEAIFEFNAEVLGQIFLVTIPPVWILCAFSLFRIFSILNNSVKEIRKKHIHYVSGRWSLKRNEIEMPYEDIAWVNVSQNVLERFVNIGSISIGTAMSDKPSIVMQGIRTPHKYAQKIYKKMAKARLKKSSQQHLHYMASQPGAQQVDKLATSFLQ